MKKIVLKDWRKRINNAIRNHSFSKEDKLAIHSPYRCVNAELAKILSSIKHKKVWYHNVHEDFPLSNKIEVVMMNAIDTNNFPVAREAVNLLEHIQEYY